MCPYIRGARCLGFIYAMGTSAPVKIAASGIQGEFSQPTSQMGGGFVLRMARQAFVAGRGCWVPTAVT